MSCFMFWQIDETAWLLHVKQKIIEKLHQETTQINSNVLFLDEVNI